MNTYRIKITLENGDEVKARSVGRTPLEAEERVINSSQFQDFRNGLKIKSIYTELEKAGSSVEINPDRYHFQPSTERIGWFVVTDKQEQVVVIFEGGKFNETQRITRLDDTLPDPLTAASGLKAIADYLHIYHPEVL